MYTKTLSAPRSQPSTRLPGVPQTRCGDVEKVCGPWRYRLSTRSYESGPPGPIIVAGFADTGSRLYEVIQREHTADFRIDELTPPSYSAASAPLR